MIKKINQYLVVNFPLIWNIRLLWAIIGLKALHLIYMLMGYLALEHYSDLSTYEYRQMFNSAGLISFSLLSSLFFMIIWLIYYFRNNPLKSIYPVSSVYLIKEFFLVVVICFMAISFIMSFKMGFKLKITHMTSKDKYIEYANAHNLSFYFIAYDENRMYYLNDEGCYPPDVSMNRSDPSGSSNFIQVNKIAEEAMPASEIPGRPCYLNYCNNEIDDTANLRDQYENHIIANRWLKNNRLDSIRLFLVNYSAILKELELDNFINTDTLMKEYENNPNFQVWTFHDHQPNYYSGEEDTYYYYDNDLSNVLENMKSAHERVVFFKSDEIIRYLFFAFGFSLLIFSFRLTKLKSWVIALLSLMLWGIITGMYLTFSRSSNDGEGLFIIYSIGFGLCSTLLIFNKANKLLSAVFLNLFTWSLIYVIPVIYEYIKDHARRKYNNSEDMIKSPEAEKLYEFYRQNENTAHFLGFVFIFLMVSFVIIPLAKKWQANPE